MSKNSKSRGKAMPQLDITDILTQQVKIRRNGKQQIVSQYELRLRAQVKKALTDKSLPAIENVLREARKFDLVMPPPPAPANGGVLVVPGRFAPGAWAALFEKPKADSDTES